MLFIVGAVTSESPHFSSTAAWRAIQFYKHLASRTTKVRITWLGKASPCRCLLRNAASSTHSRRRSFSSTNGAPDSFPTTLSPRSLPRQRRIGRRHLPPCAVHCLFGLRKESGEIGRAHV